MHFLRRLRHNYVFILIILAVWFVLRVGSRPNRALYPCQQVILTQLQVSLSSIFTPIVASFSLIYRNNLTRLFTKRNLFIGSILILAVVGGFLFNSSMQYTGAVSSISNSVTYDTPTKFSFNLPSDLKDNYPHRVVSVRSTDATS